MLSYHFSLCDNDSKTKNFASGCLTGTKIRNRSGGNQIIIVVGLTKQRKLYSIV